MDVLVDGWADGMMIRAQTAAKIYSLICILVSAVIICCCFNVCTELW